MEDNHGPARELFGEPCGLIGCCRCGGAEGPLPYRPDPIKRAADDLAKWYDKMIFDQLMRDIGGR